nr:MAG TPA: hypothetical protein [Caudoviricetes sp.]
MLTNLLLVTASSILAFTDFHFINLISKPQFSSETAPNSAEIYST